MPVQVEVDALGGECTAPCFPEAPAFGILGSMEARASSKPYPSELRERAFSGLVGLIIANNWLKAVLWAEAPACDRRFGHAIEIVAVRDKSKKSATISRLRLQISRSLPSVAVPRNGASIGLLPRVLIP